MTTLKITKSEIIREILMAVNANAERTNGIKADGDLFFSLAFRSVKELQDICKKTGIKLY